MKIKVIAPFEIARLDSDDCLDVPPGTTVNGVLRCARLKRPLWMLMPVSVNGKQVRKSHKLKEGDVVAFISPISGG